MGPSRQLEPHALFASNEPPPSYHDMQPAYFSPDPELVNPDSPEPFVDNFDSAPLEHPEPAIAEDEQRPPRQRGRPARVRSGSHVLAE